MYKEYKVTNQCKVAYESMPKYKIKRTNIQMPGAEFWFDKNELIKLINALVICLGHFEENKEKIPKKEK